MSGDAPHDETTEFLLQSLRDLEAEHDAGDLDDDDYTNLRDAYTSRAAAALRAERKGQPAPSPTVPKRSVGQWVAIVVGVVGFAVLSGLLVAQASGRRTSGQGITGEVPRTPSQRAASCIELTETQPLTLGAGGELPAAVPCYQDVLDEDPGNPVALAYLGWTLVLTARTNADLPAEVQTELYVTARRQLDAAVESDPGYADARAFQVVMAVWEQRWADAAEHLAVFDDLEAPAAMQSLIDGQRQAIAEGLAAQADAGDDGADGATTSTTEAPTTTAP